MSSCRRTSGNIPHASYKQGFTLVELLVAIALMALMGAMAWVGMDALLRGQQGTRQHTDRNASLQVMLEQWQSDLDQIVALREIDLMAWDGQVLRMTRRASPPNQGVVVAAWAVRASDGGQQLMRWQSPSVTTLGQWRTAWEQARRWGGPEELRPSVVLIPVQSMQLQVWSGAKWERVKSFQKSAADASGGAGGAFMAKAVRNPLTAVRLQLDTPDGMLTKDWVSLAWSGRKS